MIVGIDEVGRGPWAGPLVMGAVVLGDAAIEGLTDSKKLSAKRRQLLALEIKEKAQSHSLGWVHADELDEIGLSAALQLACRRALEGISVSYHEIIIDGTVNFLADTGKGAYVTTMKKADLLIGAVSAASIVAKVARDDFMARQDELFPEYGFSSHVGYGTKTHRDAIEQHGLTPLHRYSFAPIAAFAGREIIKDIPASGNQTATSIGNQAESFVCNELTARGYEIVERNWKTKACEIDIVARRADNLYFVEVKHRKNANQGDGLQAITSRKLRQMKFAALYYETTKSTQLLNPHLMVAATSGNQPVLDALFEIE